MSVVVPWNSVEKTNQQQDADAAAAVDRRYIADSNLKAALVA
jgi:hypothetical protein